MRRSIISLADALRAAADLQPADEAASQAVRALLGLEPVPERSSAPASLGAWMPSSSHNVMASQRKSHTSAQAFVVAKPAEATQAPEGETRADPARARPSTLTRLEGRSLELKPPPWLPQVTGFNASLNEGITPDMQPLFDRVRRRGILSSTLATQVPEGDLDVARIVDTVSSGQPLANLPRLPVPTLRQGVQVLLDIGQGMDPFADDQRSLVKDLDNMLADVRLEVLRFTGCPSRGVLGPAATRTRAWRLPPPGVPLLVVTDLGIGGPLLDHDRPTNAEWLDFAQGVRSAGHTLVGLVPYEASRWPTRLARAMALLHWSERTTVGAVRRALRDARRRLQA